jgi:hypothetical protein
MAALHDILLGFAYVLGMVGCGISILLMLGLLTTLLRKK